MPIVVTGFDAFGSHASNPSGQLVERLQGRPGVVAAVLPTSYERAGKRVETLLREHVPSAILSLGLSARAGSLVWEQRAANWDESATADNDGVQRSGIRIAPDGPVSYASTLPLETFQSLAAQSGVPTTLSSDAGGFVCNHVFFRAAHYVERTGLGALYGFVHLPPQSDPDPLDRLTLCIERFVMLLEEQ